MNRSFYSYFMWSPHSEWNSYNRRFRSPYTILRGILTRTHTLVKFLGLGVVLDPWIRMFVRKCMTWIYTPHRNQISWQPTISVQTHRYARDTPAGSVPCVCTIVSGRTGVMNRSLYLTFLWSSNSRHRYRDSHQPTIPVTIHHSARNKHAPTLPI